MEQLSYTFRLAIASQDYLAYYRGDASKVSAIDVYGRRVEFPAHVLRPYLTHLGIHGLFRLHTDRGHRFQSIERVED